MDLIYLKQEYKEEYIFCIELCNISFFRSFHAQGIAFLCKTAFSP